MRIIEKVSGSGYLNRPSFVRGQCWVTLALTLSKGFRSLFYQQPSCNQSGPAKPSPAAEHNPPAIQQDLSQFLSFLRQFKYGEQLELEFLDEGHQRLSLPVTDHLKVQIKAHFPRPRRNIPRPAYLSFPG